MKARLKKLNHPVSSSFHVELAGHYHSYNELHYHPEIEIIYVVEGQGTLLVGDKIEPVTSGCLLMIGANLPHLFRFDSHTFQHPLFKQGRVDLPLKLLTLHFNPEILGEQFINLPENEFMQTVIRNAGHAQQFYGGLREELIVMLNKMLQSKPHERLILLIQLMAQIAAGKEFRFLNPGIQQVAYNVTDETRLTKIYLYTLNNFHRTITLKEIAATIYMCPNSFCRYFKSRVHKSYFDFLLEVRISHARKLLKETDYSMVIVSYESGFPNLSNFNRYFKAITGKTPLACRKEYRRFF